MSSKTKEEEELELFKKHREKRLKKEAEERESVENEKREKLTGEKQKEEKMLLKAEIATTEIEKWEKRLRGKINRENDQRKHRGTVLLSQEEKDAIEKELKEQKEKADEIERQKKKALEELERIRKEREEEKKRQQEELEELERIQKEEEEEERIKEAKNYFKIGTECFKKRDYEGALENYSKALELNPNMIGVYFNRGIVY